MKEDSDRASEPLKNSLRVNPPEIAKNKELNQKKDLPLNQDTQPSIPHQTTGKQINTHLREKVLQCINSLSNDQPIMQRFFDVWKIT